MWQGFKPETTGSVSRVALFCVSLMKTAPLNKAHSSMCSQNSHTINWLHYQRMEVSTEHLLNCLMQGSCARAELLPWGNICVSLFHSAIADLDTTGLRWRMKTRKMSLAVRALRCSWTIFAFMVIVHLAVKPAWSFTISKGKANLRPLSEARAHVLSKPVSYVVTAMACHVNVCLWGVLSDEILVE